MQKNYKQSFSVRFSSNTKKKMVRKVGGRGWGTWGVRNNLETNPSQNRGWGKLKMKHLGNINSP